LTDFLHPYRHRLTVFLLTAFLLALGWSVLCNLLPHESQHAAHHPASNHSHEHHEGGHEHDHSQGHSHGKETDAHQHDESEEGCCESMAAQLFSGLIKHKPAAFSFAQSAFLTILCLQGELFIPYYAKIEVAVILNSLPPPNLPDIRVFIQSFLN
jgi:hypothetical protein